MTSYFVDILIFVFFIHQVFYWVYFLQLKEYRFDRFLSSFTSRYDLLKTILSQYNLFSWFRPKFTARSVLSIACSFVLGVFVIRFVAWWKVSVFFLAPLFAFAGIILSTPLFGAIKARTIGRAREKMKNFKGVTIGITGSYGKSSTKELLYHVLKSKFKVAKTEGNTNTEIGIAKNILDLSGDEEIFIVEMGAYRLGEIKAICEIVRPRIGIITGIGDQHLSLFGSLENIRKAKFELIESLPNDGLALVAERDFSLAEALNIQVSKEGTEFDFASCHFNVPLLGKSLARNVVAVIKTAVFLGVDPVGISKSLAGIDKNLFYPRLLRITEEVFLVDDSYNLSLESFFSIIDYMSVWEGYKKVLITPGMIELGAGAKSDHLEVGKKLSVFDLVFLTTHNFHPELNFNRNVSIETNTSDLSKSLRKLKRPKTVFVFEGRSPKILMDSITRND